MKQEPKLIYDFIPGDIVTRIEPTFSITQGMFIGGMDYDSSYIGEKLIFVGIANGCAYFEATNSFTLLLEKGKLISLELHKFEHGWAHYIDPITLLNAKPMSRYSSMSDESLVQKLDVAIAEEDYEEASRIKHEIDKREI
ncbi:MAG: hypothetical protein AABY15_00255 [Nanoarchaeota archaeon]